MSIGILPGVDSTLPVDNKWFVSFGGATVLTLLCFFVGFQAGWLESVTLLEVFAAFTSYACTILCNYQSRWNYPIGIASQIAIFFVMWTAGSPALAIFNLYLVGSLTYGFFVWKSDAATVPVTRVKNWTGYAIFGLAVLAFFYGVVYYIEPSNFANVSHVDAFIAALAGVAQLLLDRKKLETWGVWLIVNIISIPYLYSIGLYFFAFQYMFFLCNTAVGFRAWRKTMVSNQ